MLKFENDKHSLDHEDRGLEIAVPLSVIIKVCLICQSLLSLLPPIFAPNPPPPHTHIANAHT